MQLFNRLMSWWKSSEIRDRGHLCSYSPYVHWPSASCGDLLEFNSSELNFNDFYLCSYLTAWWAGENPAKSGIAVIFVHTHPHPHPQDRAIFLSIYLNFTIFGENWPFWGGGLKQIFKNDIKFSFVLHSHNVRNKAAFFSSIKNYKLRKKCRKKGLLITFWQTFTFGFWCGFFCNTTLWKKSSWTEPPKKVR